MKKNTPLSDLTLAIKSIGMSPADFATEKLGISYQLFRYRVRQGKLSLEDYWRIFHYTGKSFEQLFPNPYSLKPKPISLTLRPTAPKSRLTPPPVEKEEPAHTPVSSPPLVEEENVPGYINVYDGGLPPIDE